MKLYAKTTTEKGSKGFGGDTIIQTDFTWTNKNLPVITVTLTPFQGELLNIKIFHHGRNQTIFRDTISARELTPPNYGHIPLSIEKNGIPPEINPDDIDIPY